MVGGRYRLLEPIGAGASGEVWRAQHVTVGHFAAVKLVSLGREDPEVLARVLTEAQAAASLRSAHVVQVYDQGREGDVAYIAMELLSGESLADRLARGPMSPHDVARVVRDVGRAIGKAHAQGIIHRDLKPQNIFLTQSEGQPIAKVLDFGIAKVLAAQGATREGVVVGTPAYMSPEQISSQHPVDWRSDLWQLAIISFECLTGRLPYAAATMGELFVQIASAQPAQAIRPGELPPAFEGWFRRATAHDPAQRFQSARDLTDDLARAIAPSVAFETPSPTSAVAPWEVEAADDPWRRRMVGVAVGLAFTALLLALAIGLSLTRTPRHDAAGHDPAATLGSAGAASPGAEGDAPADGPAAEPAAAEPAAGDPPAGVETPPAAVAPSATAVGSAAPAPSGSGAPSTGSSRPAAPARPTRAHDPWGL